MARPAPYSRLYISHMNLTCHSEVGRLHTLYLKHADAAFCSDAHIAQHWQLLNYLDAPSYAEAVAEYDGFSRLVEQHAAVVRYFPQDDTVNMDSIYCRDASIATNAGMIICNMGKPLRAHEPASQQKAFTANGVPVLGVITAPGTVEGGDVAWLDDHTLAVGHTYRTNAEGIRQLTALLAPLGVQVVTVPLPHYRGPSDVFHLMSILSPVDHDLAVVYSPLMPIPFRNLLLDRGYHLVEVPDAEFDSMGCNVLALAPRVCLMVAGNPVTRSRLEAAGCTVLEYAGAHISVKGGGGPTCLTRPLWRYK